MSKCWQQYTDRREAGQLLAEDLTEYADRDDTLVFALPRGGVPVAFEIAQRLHLPLDVFLVRKLGVPGYEELAMGAIALGGAYFFNENIIEELNISSAIIAKVQAKEMQELNRRNSIYRQNRPLPDITGKTIILVDDGLATGATMRAAIAALRTLFPAQIIAAIPVAPLSTCLEIKKEADKVICLETPEPFFGVGQWYQDFSQTTDEEVVSLQELSKQHV